MIIQCYLRDMGVQKGCGIAYLERQAQPVRMARKLNNATNTVMAAMIIEDALSKFKVEHILFVVNVGDSYMLTRSIDAIIKDRNLDLRNATFSVEKYPNDFTPGSFSCKNIETLMKLLDETTKEYETLFD